MSRIDGVPPERAGIVVRFAYWLAKRMVGKVPEPLAVTAHHGWVFRAYCGYEYALGKANLVEPKIKALAGVKAATQIGCPF